MEVRILCGAYDPAGPFIEGGCARDWIECLAEPGAAVSCPFCGQHCPGPFVDSARLSLVHRTVFVLGCPHQAFTFSRRTREPYFSPESVEWEAEDGEDESREGP